MSDYFGKTAKTKHVFSFSKYFETIPQIHYPIPHDVGAVGVRGKVFGIFVQHIFKKYPVLLFKIIGNMHIHGF